MTTTHDASKGQLPIDVQPAPPLAAFSQPKPIGLRQAITEKMKAARWPTLIRYALAIAVIYYVFSYSAYIGAAMAIVVICTLAWSVRSHSKAGTAPEVALHHTESKQLSYIARRRKIVDDAYSARFDYLSRTRVTDIQLPQTGISRHAFTFMRKVAYSLYIVLFMLKKPPTWVYMPTPSSGMRMKKSAMTVQNLRFTSTKKICVWVDKGGVGKTTFALLLSLGLKKMRPEETVLTNDVDNGTLIDRVRRTTQLSMVDLYGNLEHIKTPNDLKRYCTATLNEGLWILAYSRPGIIKKLKQLTREEMKKVVDTEAGLVSFIISDLAPNLDVRNQGALDAADRVVIMTTPARDSIKKAKDTVQFMIDHGYEELARNAVIMVNRAMPWTSLDRILREFTEVFGDDVAGMRISSLLFSPRLMSGSELSLETIGPRSRASVDETVAHLAKELSDGTVSQPETQLTHIEELALSAPDEATLANVTA